jgi:hypothetical protein
MIAPKSLPVYPDSCEKIVGWCDERHEDGRRTLVIYYAPAEKKPVDWDAIHGAHVAELINRIRREGGSCKFLGADGHLIFAFSRNGASEEVEGGIAHKKDAR